MMILAKDIKTNPVVRHINIILCLFYGKWSLSHFGLMNHQSRLDTGTSEIAQLSMHTSYIPIYSNRQARGAGIMDK